MNNDLMNNDLMNVINTMIHHRQGDVWEDITDLLTDNGLGDVTDLLAGDIDETKDMTEDEKSLYRMGV